MFHKEFLTHDPEAPMGNVIPSPDTESKVSRDGLGNRIIASKELAYETTEGRLAKAALLVSPAGEAFIKCNPGILRDLNNGLVEIEKFHKSEYEKSIASLSTADYYLAHKLPREWKQLSLGRDIYPLSEGSESYVYVLRVSENTEADPPSYKYYTIKTAKYENKVSKNTIDQPYINDLLQNQTLTKERGSELNEIGVHVPEQYFATSELICTEFTPAQERKTQDSDARMYAAITIAEDMINEKKSSNDNLWANIYPDYLQLDYSMPNGNFMTQRDLTLSWIDPFVKFKNHPGFPTDVQPFLNTQEIAGLPQLSAQERVQAYIEAQKEIEPLLSTFFEYQYTKDPEDWKLKAETLLSQYGQTINTEYGIRHAFIQAEKGILKKHGVRFMLTPLHK